METDGQELRKLNKRKKRNKRRRSGKITFYDLLLPACTFLSLALLITSLAASGVLAGNAGGGFGAAGEISLVLAAGVALLYWLQREKKPYFRKLSWICRIMADAICVFDIILIICGAVS